MKLCGRYLERFKNDKACQWQIKVKTLWSPVEKARRRIESELRARNCGEWESFAKYLQGLHGRLGSLKYEDDKVPVEWLIVEDLQAPHNNKV